MGYPRECWDRADGRDSGSSASWVVLVRGISGLGIDGINQQQAHASDLGNNFQHSLSNYMPGEWFIIFIITET